MTSGVNSLGLLNKGLLPPLCPPALPMLPVPDEGESRLPCLPSEVLLGLDITEEDFTPSPLAVEDGLLPVFVPNNLQIKTKSTVIPKLRYGIHTFPFDQSFLDLNYFLEVDNQVLQ